MVRRKTISLETTSLLLYCATLTSCSVEGYEMKLLGENGAFTQDTQRDARLEIKQAMDAGKCIDYDGNSSCENGSIPYEGAPQIMIGGVTRNIIADQHRYEKDRGRKTRTPDLEDYTLRIVGDHDELRENCGEFAGACHKSHVPGLVWQPIDFCTGVGTMGHEAGHAITEGDLEEMSSEAWELYYPVKFMQFENQLGSICVHHMFADVDATPTEWMSSRAQMYETGALLGAYMLIESNGDIEHATDRIRNSHNNSLKNQLYTARVEARQQIRSEYGMPEGTFVRPADELYYFLEKGLSRQGFIDYLTSERGHMTSNNAIELQNYLLIRLRYVNLGHSSIKDEYQEELPEMLDSFIENPTTDNPYFRSYAINAFTPLLFEELEDIISDKGIESSDAYDTAVKLLNLNADFPCGFTLPSETPVEPEYRDPFTCPQFVRDIESEDILTHEYLMKSATASGDFNKLSFAANKSLQYVEKYYPGFSFGSLAEFDAGFIPEYDVIVGEHITSTVVPYLMFEAAEIIRAQQEGTYPDTCEFIQRLYEVALAAECTEDAIYKDSILQNCELAQTYSLNRLSQGCNDI